VDVALSTIILIITVALIFDFINGFHDAANSIATVVSTRVLSPGKAVLWAAVFNFSAAFFFGTEVAHTVGAGMVDLEVVTYSVILTGLLGAITWNLITWYFGLPTSSSHALFGGYGGAAVAKAGFGAIIVAGWTKTLIFIVVAPVIGLCVGLLLMTSIFWIFRDTPPTRVAGGFRYMQLLSAAAYSLMHGANDAQKTMGIITGALVTGGYLPTFHVPVWVILIANAAIGLGTLSGGWRIIKTMGRRHQHDPHDHRRNHRRRRHASPERGALGCRAADRVGLDSHDSGVGLDRRRRVLPVSSGVRSHAVTEVYTVHSFDIVHIENASIATPAAASSSRRATGRVSSARSVAKDTDQAVWTTNAMLT
jgi:PiT family inorganic phosphate transporter